MSDSFLVIHALMSFYMTGVIWMTQLVHYPLFARVGSDFKEYHRRHVQGMGFVVGGPMIAEAVTGGLLLLNPPPGVEPWILKVTLFLLAVVWMVTGIFSVPAHNRLAQNFDTAVWRRLVATNWIRTAGWTLRSLLLAYSISKLPV